MPAFTRRHAALALLAWGARGALAQPAATPGWPVRPLRIIVGFPPGSSPDLTARTFADPLAQALGQPVIVENKTGAAGNIGASAVARARGGHTIGLFINGNLTIARLLNPQLPYDPAKDLAPLSLVGVAPLVLAAPVGQSGVPSDGDARAFLAAARQAGARWSYGTPGVGTVGHLGMELLKARTGIAPVHVPYPGYPQVITAMLGGQLQMALLPPAFALAQQGRLRPIGLTSARRSPLAPGVPSLAEAGVQDMQLEMWNAFAAPASMPEPVRARLAALTSQIARGPGVRAALLQQGWQAIGSSPEELARRIQADTLTLGEIIRLRHIQAQ
jgi:tripartite-type tricarboxylate transporter receptor subunit TctC